MRYVNQNWDVSFKKLMGFRAFAGVGGMFRVGERLNDYKISARVCAGGAGV